MVLLIIFVVYVLINLLISITLIRHLSDDEEVYNTANKHPIAFFFIITFLALPLLVESIIDVKRG